MTQTTNTNRANRVVVQTNDNGTYTAVYYRTHAVVGSINSTDGWTAPTGKATSTTKRESFRAWAIEHAADAGVDWNPEYQQQSWERKYWKYETDEQVEEDARELMAWTITQACKKFKHTAEVVSITLDSIVPNDSNLSYVEFGKYTKTGNWAVATVNLDVEVIIDEVTVNVIWAIEMRSGQLTKVKITNADLKAMMEDAGVA